MKNFIKTCHRFSYISILIWTLVFILKSSVKQLITMTESICSLLLHIRGILKYKNRRKVLNIKHFSFFSTSNPSIWIGSGVSFIILSNWHYPGLHGHNKFFTSRGLEKKLHDFSFFRIFFSHKYIFHNKKKYGKFLIWVMV